MIKFKLLVHFLSYLVQKGLENLFKILQIIKWTLVNPKEFQIQKELEIEIKIFSLLQILTRLNSITVLKKTHSLDITWDNIQIQILDSNINKKSQVILTKEDQIVMKMKKDNFRRLKDLE